jgi:hypothetical protein
LESCRDGEASGEEEGRKEVREAALLYAARQESITCPLALFYEIAQVKLIAQTVVVKVKVKEK